MLKIDKNGVRFWRNEKGEFHRINGPAVEWNNGSKYWYINGERHRVDGPAVEFVNGSKYWYINGEEYTEAQYKEEVGEIC